MEILSLQEPEPPPPRKVTRSEAQIVSLLLHALMLFLLLYAPQRLPKSVLAWLEGRPAPAPAPTADRAASEPLSQPSQPLRAPKIPLKFAYLDPSVRVPNAPLVKDNPKAPILSNRNRLARQEVRTPPEARNLTIDPHSEGNTIARVRPDPSRPEGPEQVEPTLPPKSPTEGGGKASAEPAGGGADHPGSAGSDVSRSRGAQEPRPVGQNGLSPAPPSGAAVPGTGGAPGPGFPGSGAGTGHDLAAQAADQLQQMMRDVHSGEYKDTYRNPGYLEEPVFGTMSFDTKNYPWGDYARQVYVRLYNAVKERLPPAFRLHLRGYSCDYFVIERDGTISQVLPTKRSEHPPYNQVPYDSIRAVSPLPPLPRDFPKEREGVTYCFFFNMFPGEAE
jgi:hypothetical protein